MVDPAGAHFDLAPYARAVHRLVRAHCGISLPVRLPGGESLGPPDAPFRVVLRAPWALRALLLPDPLRGPSDLAAGEAYVRGDVDVEGDLVAAMRVVSELGERGLPVPAKARMARLLLRTPAPPRETTRRRARLRGRRHTRARDQAAIAFHYDLPQAFYESFLDEELVYSCAYFASPEEDLATAQRRKLDLICRKLGLEPGMRLLDIGCGWGSLLAHAATHYGVTGVGVTLSQTQAVEGRRRLAARGLGDRIELRLQDYRDVEERFDAIASVGMVEHVGPSRLPEYYTTVRGRLAPGGRALSHGIVTGDPACVRHGPERTFIGCHVFPDGGLAPAWLAVREAERAGFELLDVEQLRPHYALTLRAWLRNLATNTEEARDAAGDADLRTWEAYMAGSAAAFEARDIGVVQLLLGKEATVPLGRAWMRPDGRAVDTTPSAPGRPSPATTAAR